LAAGGEHGLNLGLNIVVLPRLGSWGGLDTFASQLFLSGSMLWLTGSARSGRAL
jgi:hypothetical protein